MVQKSESEASKQNGEATTLAAEKRQRLVARVAGSVASGIVQAPSKTVTTAAAIAEIAVDIAEQIVKKAGL